MMKKIPIMVLPEFLECAASLTKDAKSKLLKIMKLLSENIRHPGLQSKRVKGSQAPVYECRVDQGIRLIYDRNKDTLRCWYVGTHDSALTFATSGNIPEGFHIDDIEFREIREDRTRIKLYNLSNIDQRFLNYDLESFISKILEKQV